MLVNGSAVGGQWVISPWLRSIHRPCGLDVTVFLHPRQKGRYKVWLIEKDKPPVVLLTTEPPHITGWVHISPASQSSTQAVLCSLCELWIWSSQNSQESTIGSLVHLFYFFQVSFCIFVESASVMQLGNSRDTICVTSCLIKSYREKCLEVVTSVLLGPLFLIMSGSPHLYPGSKSARCLDFW